MPAMTHRTMTRTPKIAEPDFTLGIEEEYLLVDRTTRDLVTEHPNALFADCEAMVGDQVAREFLTSQIEVGTKVHKTARAAGDELRHLRSVVVEKAAAYNLAPIAASTHPFTRWNDQQPTERPRYTSIAKDLAGVGRHLVICGMHVHVGLGDNELRMDLMNQARYFLPHLLTLSTSSPFREGEDTGLKCCRLAAYRELPRTGMPGRFDSWDEYRRNVDVLIGAGIIEDATKIWWDIRPSDRYPTLEMRVTDVCTRIEDAVAVAALYVCVLRMLWRLRRSNQRWRQYPVFLLEENRWRAMRYGVGGTLFDLGKGTLEPFPALLDEILDLVKEDATALDCMPEIAHTREIAQRGTSADRQVAVYEAAVKAGARKDEALRKVVDHLAAETRGA
jgi:glutamate---cysteine ligase / carboxylate-amine ligase